MSKHVTMDAYDALRLEHEKQAALIDMLAQALCSGPPSPNLSDYMAVMEDQHRKATEVASMLYESAIKQEGTHE